MFIFSSAIYVKLFICQDSWFVKDWRIYNKIELHEKEVINLFIRKILTERKMLIGIRSASTTFSSILLQCFEKLFFRQCFKQGPLISISLIWTEQKLLFLSCFCPE